MEPEKVKIVTALILVFLCVQAIGLTTGYRYLELVSAGEVEPAIPEGKESIASVLLFAYILFATGIILLIVKFKKKLLTAVEGLAIFFTSSIVFELLIPVGINIPGAFTIPIGIPLALTLTVIHLSRPTYLTQNVALIFAVSGAGAILGASLGVMPVLIFILFLGIYDFISVFYTKHMLYMAKAITERPRAFTAAFPTNIKSYTKTSSKENGEEGKTKRESGHTFQLGGGDLAIPLMFTVSLLNISIISALAASLGALTALILLFTYILKRPGIALPALPPVTAGAVTGFLLSLLII